MSTIKKIKVASMGAPTSSGSNSGNAYISDFHGGADASLSLVTGLPLTGGVLEYGDGTDLDLSIHRRKLLRRAANRKSAQLSRARKKVRPSLGGCSTPIKQPPSLTPFHSPPTR